MDSPNTSPNPSASTTGGTTGRTDASSYGTSGGSSVGRTDASSYGASSGATSGGTSGETTMGDQAQQGMNQVVEQAQQLTEEVVSRVQDKAKTLVSDQQERVAGSVGSVAEALRTTGQQLTDQPQSAMVAQYATSAADQIDRFADYLRNADVMELMSEAERFGRREPALFLGGALALGLVLARFLKSSAPQPDDEFYYPTRYEGGASGGLYRRYERERFGGSEYGRSDQGYGGGEYGRTDRGYGEERYGRYQAGRYGGSEGRDYDDYDAPRRSGYGGSRRYDSGMEE